MEEKKVTGTSDRMVKLWDLKAKDPAAASKRYTTATSEQCHRNIRGGKTP